MSQPVEAHRSNSSKAVSSPELQPCRTRHHDYTNSYRHHSRKLENALRPQEGLQFRGRDRTATRDAVATASPYSIHSLSADHLADLCTGSVGRPSFLTSRTRRTEYVL